MRPRAGMAGILEDKLHFSTGIRTPYRPASSEALYRLHYPGHLSPDNS